MKQKTLRNCLTAFLALLLTSAVAVCFLLAFERDREAETKVSAAIPNPSESLQQTGICNVCGESAYNLRSAADFAYLVKTTQKSGGGGAAGLDSCYALSCDLNISGWDDTSVGGLTAEEAFSGHFNGNGYTVTYSVRGGDLSGLFPYIAGSEENPASVINLNCAVSQTTGTDAPFLGALSLSAQNAVIDGVSVIQSVSGEELVHAAGIVISVDEGATVKNCTVTLSVPAGGAAYEYSAGIAYYNGGTVQDCRVVATGGRMDADVFGGIAVDNYGLITGCSSYFPVGGITGIAYGEEETAQGKISNFIGGIAAVNYAGAIRNSSSVFNFGGENPATLVGGIVGKVRNGAVTGCVSEGVQIQATSGAGGIAGAITETTPGFAVEISDCVSAVSSVTVTNGLVGGLVGYIACGTEIIIENCLTSSNVTGQLMAGGIIGTVQFLDTGTVESPHTFTLTDSRSEAQTVTALGPDMLTYAGGAIGWITGNYDNLEINVSNCETYASVTACGGNNGGFIGSFEAMDSPDKANNEYTFTDCAAYGSVTATDGKGVSDHNDENLGNSGGFIGHAPSTAANLKIGACSAYGSVRGRTAANEILHHTAGFFGYNRAQDTLVENCAAYGDAEGGAGSGGFIGRSDGGTIRNCESYGSISGEWVSGGFIGCAKKGVTVTGCVSRGNCYKNPYSTWNNYSSMGGFAGGIEVQSSFTDCTSYGSAEGNSNVGGFAGSFNGTTCTFTNCVSYGDAINTTYNVYDYIGGFLGSSNASSSISFLNCTAYGNVRGNAAGGFVGRADGNRIDFEGCTSYGSITANGGDCTYGGFLGWTYCSTVSARNCNSYGSMTGSDIYHAQSDAGGFFGHSSGTVFTVSNCHSYAESIVANPNFIAGFCYAAAPGSTFTDCSYTVTSANLSFFVAGFAGTGLTSNITTTPPVPPADAARPDIDCTIQNAGGNLSLTLRNFRNLAANLTVSSLLLSTDGGKTYTDLAHNGRLLVGMTVNGAPAPAGARVAVTPALTVAYEYSIQGGYPAGSVQLIIQLSNGYSKRFLA